MPEYLDVCEEAVRAAGAVLLKMLGRVTVREKGRADLVTEADVAAQETVRKIVLSAFPSHGLIGEEDKPGTAPIERPDFCWVVDPLDGTTNFVHQVPHFAVSLALERRGELLAGAVFDPIGGECFTAARGKGAWLNAAPIRTSATVRLADSLVAVGFPAVVTPETPDLKLFIEAAQTCQSLRRTGSAALNLAYVANGRFDISWAMTCKTWDVAAGILLVREAGGVVSRMDGSDLPLEHGPFVASASRDLHGEALALIRRALG